MDYEIQVQYIYTIITMILIIQLINNKPGKKTKHGYITQVLHYRCA